MRMDKLFLQYYEHRLPIDPSTWPIVLNFHRQDDLVNALGETSPHLQEYQSIITALSHLPIRTETDPERIAERYREKEVIRRRLSPSSQNIQHSMISSHREPSDSEWQQELTSEL